MSLSRVTKGIISTKSPASITSGDIVIESDTNSLITLPIKSGYFDMNTGQIIRDSTISTIENYVMDQIEYKYGSPVQSFIRMATRSFVDEFDEESYKTYIPGKTPTDNSHNFNLVEIDSGTGDITHVSFWIRSEVLATPIILSW